MSRFIVVMLMLLSTAHAATILSFDNNVDDLFMPGPKAVAAKDAWSLYTNPAGIAYVDGAQFVGGYSYRVANFDNGRHLAEGGLALSVFKGVSVGLGLQLSLPQAQVGDDQGLIGGAFGLAYRYDQFISVGARIIKQRQYKNAASDPFLFGLGIESFPVSWLSLGASVSQVYDDILSTPEIRAGVAFLPFGEGFALSAETLFFPKDVTANGAFAVYPELGAKLDFGGLSFLVSARASDVTQGFSAPTIFAGIEFNFDHLGFGLVSQGHPTDRVSVGGRFRLSSETWPTLALKRERIVSRDAEMNYNYSRSNHASKRRSHSNEQWPIGSSKQPGHSVY